MSQQPNFFNDSSNIPDLVGPNRTLADRRRLHHRPWREDRSRGGRRGSRATARTPGAANACPTRATTKRPEATQAALAAMRDAVARGLDTQTLQTAMPAGAARNALDCALWDYRAKASGTRVWDLLKRGAPKPLTTAYTISLGTADAMAEATAKAAHRPLLKIKLGGDGDEARIGAVRKAAPDSELIVDANESWTERQPRPQSRRLRGRGRHAGRAAAAGGPRRGAGEAAPPDRRLRRRERARPRLAQPRCAIAMTRSTSSSTRPAG